MFINTKTLLSLFLAVVTSAIAANGQTKVSGEQSGTWKKSGSPYIIDGGGVVVAAGNTLTIEAGVEVMSKNYADVFTINGTLIAKGKVTDSIRFTGFPNPQNSASTQGGQLDFENSGKNCMLQYVAIDRWGDKNYQGTALTINTPAITITNCSIRNSGTTGIGIRENATGQVKISDSEIRNSGGAGISIAQSVSPVITGVTFTGNKKDILSYPSSLSGISGCNNTAIYLLNDELNSPTLIPKPGTGSYYILQGGFTIAAGQVVTIKAGVEIRSMDYADVITVNGTLSAQGSQADSIRFTGFANPSNLSSTQGGRIDFETDSKNSVLQFVSVNKWGDKNYFGTAITINTPSLSITKSTITGSGAMALDIQYSATSKVMVSNNTIVNSGTIGINIAESISPVISDNNFVRNGKAIQAFPTSVSGLSNCRNTDIYLANTTVQQPATIPQPGLGSFYVLQGGFSIWPNTVLTIKPGVEIRSMNYSDRIDVQGTLVAEGMPTDSIRFTGYPNPLNPNSTHGGIIDFEPGSEKSSLKFVSINRWGDKSYSGSAVILNAEGVSIINSSVRNSGAVGIDIQSSVSPFISNDTFAGNPKDIQTSPSGTGNISNCSNAAIYLINEDVTSPHVIAQPGPGSYYILQGGFTIAPNVKLTIQPGVEIRSYNYNDVIIVNGTLSAEGTQADSIRFTGFPNQVNPNSTHGGNIDFEAGSEHSVLKYVTIDNWGDKNYYGTSITLNAGLVSISNCRISNSGATGITTASAIGPIIRTNVFANNPKSILAYATSLSGITANKNAGIYIINDTFTADATIAQPGPGSYYALQGGFTIAPGVKVRIQPGVEIRSLSYADIIQVEGALIAEGTVADSVRFNGFPNPANPNSTHGGNINFDTNSSGSSLKYVAVNNWGDKNYNGTAIFTYTTGVAITNSSVHGSEGNAIQIGDDISPSITLNDFYGTTGINTSPSSLGAILQNSNARILIRQGNILANMSWPNPGKNSYYTLGGLIYVQPATVLTIEQGTSIDFGDGGGDLVVDGTLRAQGTKSGVIRFSRPGKKESTVGGRVYLSASSTQSVLTYVNFDRMGSVSAYYPALTIASADVSADHIVIENSALNGLEFAATGTGTIINSNFFNNKTGIRVSQGSPVFNNCNIYGNIDFGINNQSNNATDTVDARNSYWGDVTGPYHSSNIGGKGDKVSDRVKFKPFKSQSDDGIIRDITLAAIVSPISDCNHTRADSVTIAIGNLGNSVQTALKVTYRLNKGEAVTEAVSGISLAPGKTINYTFSKKADLSAKGDYVLTAFVFLAGDNNRLNDSLKVTVQHLPDLNAPANLLPANNAQGVELPGQLSWTAVSGATGYDVYVWKNTDPVPAQPVAADINQISYAIDLDNFVFGATYKWKVVARRASCRSESATAAFTTRKLPDLVVSSINIPLKAVSETDIVVSWKVKNQGNGGTGMSAWKDIVYLCDQPNISTSLQSYVIAEARNFSSLTAGQTYESEKITFRLPQGLQGQYYVIVQTNISQNLQELNKDNNLLVSSVINISLAPPPDLQVTKVIAGPLTAFSGDSVSVTYTVKNAGTGPTTMADWDDMLFLSTTPSVNTATDPQLKIVAHSGALIVDGEYSVVTKIRLPDHIDGTFYINAVTDASGQVFEYNREDNNSLASLPLNIINRPTPNLAIKSFTASSGNITFNQPVNVRWTTVNSGAVGAGSPWEDEVYLSASPVFNSNGVIPIGTYSNKEALTSLGSYDALLSVHIPDRVNAGTYYLFVKADARNRVDENTDEGDNVSAASAPVQLVYPDLQANSLVVPSIAFSGQPLDVQWQVTNSGGSGIYNSTWTDKLYLSADKLFDAEKDILLAQTNVNSFLTAGASYRKAATVKLPVGVSGAVYLLLVTNADNTMPESDQSDNLVASPVNISLSAWPDLKLTSITTPVTDTAGSSIRLKYNVINAGAGTVDHQNWIDQVYLSTRKDTSSAGLIFLSQISQSRTMAPGDSYEQQALLPIPADLPQGKYYIIVKANYRRNLFENNSLANNTLAGNEINIVNQLPVDLSVISGEPLTAELTAGKPADIQWTVKNNSDITTIAPGWRDAIYLSTDPVFDASDKLLANVQINKILTAGASYTQTARVTIPQDAGSTVYLLVVTDKENVNLDNNRGNNTLPLSRGTGGQPVVITLPPPVDLQPSNFTTDQQAKASQPVAISFTVKNTGKGDIINGSWTDVIFLSGNTVTPDGPSLGSFPHSGNLAAGATYTVKDRVFLPEGISGNYVIMLSVDEGNSVFERGNDNNNIRTGGLHVSAQQPSDLVIKNVGFPPGDQAAGDSTTITWALYNKGSNIAEGYLRDAVYLSRDSVLDAGDLLFGTLEKSIYLSPKTTELSSLRAPLNGVTAGEYYVLVKTDILNNIVEQNENNNTASSPPGMTISVKQLPLNTLTKNILDNTLPLYYRLEIPSALNGETLSVKLSGDSAHNAINRVFIKKDTVPNANNYDFAAIVPFKANQELIVPALATGTYYLTLLGADTAKTKQPVTILAKTIPFGISGIDAPQGGNTGQVTVKITGAKFEPGMTVKLTGASTYIASSVYYVDPSKLFATFSLDKATIGTYTLRLEKQSGTSAQQPNGFRIVAGTPGGSSAASQLFTCRIQNIGFDESVKLDVIHPESVRRNQQVKMTVAYTNAGNVDIPVQTRILLSLEGAPINFKPDFSKQIEQLSLEFKEADGPPGILRAGTSGFINIYTYAIAPMSFEITQ